MTSPLPDSLLDEVNGLVFACLSGEAGPEDVEHLNELLFNSEPARRIYAHTIRDSLILRQWAAATELHSGEMFDGGDSDAAFLRLAIVDADLIATASSSNICGDEPRNAAPVVVVPVLSYFGTAYHGTIDFFSQELPFSLLIAAVLTGLGLWIASLVYVSSPEKIAKNSLPTATIVDPTMEVVGKITGMVDCNWADPQTATIDGANVLLGRKYALSSGLMEITYDTGAKVILQGPVTYEVKSRNSGFLPVGKLTGKMEVETAKGFAIRTPTATVTDLGTEFGVEVSKEGNTTSHVFRGSVLVQMVSADGTADGEGHMMYANQSALVEKRSGKQNSGNRMTVFVQSVIPADFVREISRNDPKQTIKTFDLIDVVAGGDGFSGNRDASIDPTTGQRSKSVLYGNSEVADPNDLSLSPAGDGKYHRVEGVPFVDGVFLPDGSIGPVQVDSAGHLFADCPKTANKNIIRIWAGGAVPCKPATIPTTIDGVDYVSQGHGILFLHANNGITFDLDAIRKANPGWMLKRFRAVAGNTESVSESGKSAYADVWVLVDGKVRFRRWQITAFSGGFSVSIPFTRNDHFLTLISTDGGNGPSCDCITFGDPQLEFVAVNDQQTSLKSTSKGGQ